MTVLHGLYSPFAPCLGTVDFLYLLRVEDICFLPIIILSSLIVSVNVYFSSHQIDALNFNYSQLVVL